MQVCQCVDCCKSLYTDESDGTTKSGRRFKTSAYKTHQVSLRQQRGPPVLAVVYPGAESEETVVPHKTSQIRGVDDKEGAQRRFPALDLEPVVSVLLTLAVWLYLACGISRNSASLLLKAFGLVIEHISTAFGSFESVPKDIRTAVSQLALEPKIIRVMVCSGCFTQYELTGAPRLCPWRKSPGSRSCNTPLFRVQQSGRGLPKFVPNRLYSTQDLPDWLSWFLQRDGIEEELDSSLSAVKSEVMRDVWQSPAWESMGDFRLKSGNLVFGIFIDWYNPLTNKIAGKKMSLGVILLVCYSLPYEIRWLPVNLFMLGITPGLKEPTVTTLNHILKPTIDALLRFEDGEYVVTRRAPAGRLIKARLLPSIKDAVAGQKLEGHASHSAKQFCPYCEVPRSKLGQMTLSAPQRTNASILRDAAAYKLLTTEKARAAHVKKTGMRWSEMHRLPYRDQLLCNILGMMHNWPIGILQHHARRKWGLDIERANNSDDSFKSAPVSDNIMALDLDNDEDLEEEVQDLLMDAAADLQDVANSQRTIFPREGTAPVEEDEETDSTFVPDADDEEAEVDGPEEAEEPVASVFSKDQIARIRAAIADSYLPSWIDRPPSNLGEKAHGKLKADNWHVLFSILFVFSLPEMWLLQDTKTSLKLLDNFYDLAGCTNILFNYTTSSRAAKIFSNLYNSYHTTLSELFPGAGLVPNHHYALHLGMLMEHWGPLIRVSEFGGERVIGQLQQIKTNHKTFTSPCLCLHLTSLTAILDQFDFTALRQICRKSRLIAFLQSTTEGSSLPLRLKTLLLPAVTEPSTSSKCLTGIERAAFNKFGQYMPTQVYNGILLIANKTRSRGNQLRHYTNLPYPRTCEVLSRIGQEALIFQKNDRSISLFERNANNGIIWLQDPRTKEKQAAKVTSIWRVEVSGFVRTFVEVGFFDLLSDIDQALNWCRRYPFFFVSLFYTQSSHTAMIEDCDIICQGAALVRPSGTFGIKQETILIADLDRRRSM